MNEKEAAGIIEGLREQVAWMREILENLPLTLPQALELHAKWQRSEEGGIRLDLRNADLRRALLSGADLRNADLSVANLRGSELRRANLFGADLRGTIIRRADLHDVDLRTDSTINDDTPSVDSKSSSEFKVQ